MNISFPDLWRYSRGCMKLIVSVTQKTPAAPTTNCPCPKRPWSASNATSGMYDTIMATSMTEMILKALILV